MIALRYEKGSLVAEGGPIPYGRYDASSQSYVAPAYRYREVVEHLESRGLDYRDDASLCPAVTDLSSDIKLRDYQEDALGAWSSAGHRGIIVLPTGAGKTVVALKAMEELGEATLIVVPTLVLVDQWRRRMEEEFGVNVGVLGGGSRDVRAITVATYASASMRAESIGNLFSLLVFDEVHHLPASSYRRIGLMYTAPHRMGSVSYTHLTLPTTPYV